MCVPWDFIRQDAACVINGQPADIIGRVARWKKTCPIYDPTAKMVLFVPAIPSRKRQGHRHNRGATLIGAKMMLLWHVPGTIPIQP